MPKKLTKKKLIEQSKDFGYVWGQRVCQREPKKFGIWYESIMDKEGPLFAKEFKKSFDKCMKEKKKR